MKDSVDSAHDLIAVVERVMGRDSDTLRWVKAELQAGCDAKSIAEKLQATLTAQHKRSAQ